MLQTSTIFFAKFARYRLSQICTIELCNMDKLFTRLQRCAQCDHCFHNHMHTVKRATVEQCASWFCGQSDATLEQDAT